MPNILIFEDDASRSFLPLTCLRPVWELRCGILTLREKIEQQYKKSLVDLHCRDYIAHFYKTKFPGRLINNTRAQTICLFLNGRILADKNLADQIPLNGIDAIYISSGQIVAARLSKGNLEEVKRRLKSGLDLFIGLGAKTIEVKVKVVNYVWDLVRENKSEIAEDFKILDSRIRRKKGKVHRRADIYEKKKVFIGKGAEICAQAVLDARNGPIYIGPNAIVKPHSYIEGPAYIGEGAQVLGGQMRAGTNIGPYCKVNGEISNSIILGCSNKAHYGFLGDSYIGEWVNLGAGTTTSNLKNTYGKIKVKVRGAEIDTNMQFFGCAIGDHSKLGIGTLITTGASIGIFANVFGGGITPKEIPSFSWGTKEDYNLDKAIETAKAVMGRRGITVSEEYIKLIRHTQHCRVG